MVKTVNSAKYFLYYSSLSVFLLPFLSFLNFFLLPLTISSSSFAVSHLAVKLSVDFEIQFGCHLLFFSFSPLLVCFLAIP